MHRKLIQLLELLTWRFRRRILVLRKILKQKIKILVLEILKVKEDLLHFMTRTKPYQ